MASEQDVIAELDKFNEIEEDVKSNLAKVTSLIDLLVSLRSFETPDATWSPKHPERPLRVSRELLEWKPRHSQQKMLDETDVDNNMAGRYLSYYRDISTDGCDVLYNILSDLIQAFYVDLIYSLNRLDIQYENILDTGATYFLISISRMRAAGQLTEEHLQTSDLFHSCSQRISERIAQYMECLWSQMVPFIRHFISVVLRGLHASWGDAMACGSTTVSSHIEDSVRRIEIEELNRIRDLYLVPRQIQRHKKTLEDVCAAMVEEL